MLNDKIFIQHAENKGEKGIEINGKKYKRDVMVIVKKLIQFMNFMVIYGMEIQTNITKMILTFKQKNIWRIISRNH